MDCLPTLQSPQTVFLIQNKTQRFIAYGVTKLPSVTPKVEKKLSLMLEVLMQIAKEERTRE